MAFLQALAGPPVADLLAYRLGIELIKHADDDPRPAYNLSGVLHLADGPGGWLLLAVPNALVRGVFAAMDEPGITLPPDSETGKLNAHISVMRPEEIAQLGGPDKVTERGKRFAYSIGRLTAVDPAGWPDIERCWMLTVHSPELQALRRSYGLSSLPKDGQYPFHITVAVRKRGTLARNAKSKAAGDEGAEVRAVVDKVPDADLYGAWYHPGLGKVRVSFGDWSETPSREVHEALDALLGPEHVELDYEIGRPEPFDGWEKLALDL